MKTFIVLCTILLSVISCSNPTNTNSSLILGTWLPQKNNEPVNEQMVFNKDNTLFAQSVIDGTPKTEVIMEYEFSDDGKYLITKEKNGKKEEIEIIELTTTDLKLMRKNSLDTFHLKKK